MAHSEPKLIPLDHSVVVFCLENPNSNSSIILQPEISQIGLPPKFDIAAEMTLARPIGSVKGEGLVDGRGNFVLADGFLCAEPDGQIQTDRRQASAWETFLLVELECFKALKFISEVDWHSYTHDHLIQQQAINFKPNFEFSMGNSNYRLSELVNAINENIAIGNIIEPEFFKNFTLNRDGWKIEHYSLFNPLIYFVVFGSEIEDQIRIALDSLRSLGKYKGTVLIIHNSRNVDGIIAEFAMDFKIKSWNVRATDKLEHFALRYVIGRWREARRYAPLLYSDADVVFDRPITPILHEILLSDKLSAQIEEFSPLAEADSVGAALFCDDRGIPPGHTHGFNSGLISIPDIDRFSYVLHAVASTMLNFAKVAGRRDAPVCYDQPYANYIFLTLSTFDGALLSKYVRYMDSSGNFSHNAPIGFVHFWGPRGRKHDEMKIYLDSFRADYEEVAE